MITPQRLAATLLVITSFGTAGCSGLPADPYTEHATARAQPPRPARTVAASRSARTVVWAFTESFINWKFTGLPALKRHLVADAAGPLAVQLRRDAQAALSEVSRRMSNQSNSGTVEAVVAKGAGSYLIVTHETAHLGDDAAQSGYFIYRATVRRSHNTYKLTRFEART